MGRPLKIIGNWKMHKTLEEGAGFVRGLAKILSSIAPKEVYLAVPFTVLASVAKEAVGIGLEVGSQNISEHTAGAYTGEISTIMVKDCGGSFSLIGHSERRRLYHEDDTMIANKMRRCLLDGVTPVLCIGETEHERKEGKAHHILEMQLKRGLSAITSIQDIEKIFIAYEPVWAIGTGHAATAEEAQSIHRFCREFLQQHYGHAVSEKVPLLYGGSVNLKTVGAFMQQSDIDGVLVGGASLEVDSFSAIVNLSREIKS